MLRFIACGSLAMLLLACSTRNISRYMAPSPGSDYTGTAFFQQVRHYSWQQRDSLAMQWFKQGAVPSWWKHFKRIKVSERDSAGQRKVLRYWVSPDYLVLGTNADWVRVPITPMAAQQMMDEVGAGFPTPKMVDQIYASAKVQLSPMPMVAFRDSSQTMFQHHLIIEGQRKGRNGLIAGIKKDVVTTARLAKDARGNRVAIYGWHLPEGVPIQPLYTGHVNWYVDYSHGIRFVKDKLRLNGKTVSLQSLLADAQLSRLLCNEDSCSYFKYPLIKD